MTSAALVLPSDAAPHLVRHGDGDRVFVALHGWSGSHQSFEPLLAHMPEDVVLLAYDQPGFGRSPSPPDWSLDTLVELLERPLDVARPFTLVGVSGGALLCLYWALRLGVRVERIVMIDPFAYMPWYFKLFTLPWAGALLYHLVFGNPMGRMLTNAGLRPHRTTYPDLVGGFRSVRHGDNLNYLRALSVFDRMELSVFSSFRGRVDILYGEKTFAAVRRSLPTFESLFSQVRCIEIPGAGHLPVFEAPVFVAREVFRP